MVASSWFTAAVGVAALMASVNGAFTPHSHPVFSIVSSRLSSNTSIQLRNTTRTGNWTQIRCTNDLSQHPYKYTPSEQWSGLAADDAWRDIVMLWKRWNDTDRAKQNYTMTFLQGIGETTGLEYESGCGNMGFANCPVIECLDGTIDHYYVTSDSHYLSGAAATLIWNSLATIHDIHVHFDAALSSAVYKAYGEPMLINRTALTDMEKTFAPTPEPLSNNITWNPLVADLTTLGTVSIVGSYAISMLNRRPWFSDKSPDRVKNTTMTLLRPWIALAQAGLSSSKEYAPWEEIQGTDFSHVMTRAIQGWAAIPALAIQKLFDGSPESIEILGDAISDGKLLEPGKWAVELPYVPARLDLEPIVAKTFFGYAIPALWRLSNTYAFIIDSGFGCDAEKPLGTYLADSTRSATGACVEGKRYYLVHPAGSSSSGRFSAPPGLDRLPGFGGVTKEDLIKGSVRTWIRNDKKNGGGFADPTNNATFDSLLDVDITAPGFIRLPVCSVELAFQSWGRGSAGSSDNYPCDVTSSASGGRDSGFGYSRTVAVVVLSALLHIM